MNRDLSDSEHGLVVGAIQNGLAIAETADLKKREIKQLCDLISLLMSVISR